MGNTPFGADKEDSEKEEKERFVFFQNGNHQVALNQVDSSHVKIITLVGQKLEKLPDAVYQFPHIQQLHLFNNQFTEAPKFEKFDNLTSIDFSFNRLKSISELTKISTLKQLMLVGNCLTKIPPSITNLTALEQLKISLNDITEIPDFVFSLPHLMDLMASFNKISLISVNPETLKAPLQTLFLDDNSLDKFSPFLCQITTLRTLRIGENELETLPEEIGNLTNLQTLDARDNRIVELPASLSNLHSLRVLSLGNNQLKELPTVWFLGWRRGSIGDFSKAEVKRPFPALYDLLLPNNHISSLYPNFFEVFQGIALLNLSYNKLSEIPPGIEKASQLLQLELACNEISHFPNLSGLSKLSKLNLTGNQVSRVFLSHLPSLRSLYLAYNRIKEFPALPERLEELHLNGCSLLHFPSIILTLTQLSHLYMGNNLIQSIPTELVKMSSLQCLDVSYNMLHEVPIEFQSKLKEISGGRARNEKKFLLCIEGNDIHPDFVEHKQINYQPSKRFRIGYSEMTGRRVSMEDSLFIAGQFADNPDHDVIGLFDGHGGAEVANFAALNFPKIIEKKLKKMDPIDTLKGSLQTMNKQLKKNFEEKKTGSTGLLALFLDKKLYVANVGDTRAVICNGGVAERLTFDHRPLVLEERIRIAKLGGFVMENGRVNGILGVARSLGDFYLTPFVSEEPFVRTIDITDDHSFVIFACDGCFDVLTDQQSVDIVKKSLSINPDPGLAASALRDHAFLLGSGDNISVIVVVLKPS